MREHNRVRHQDWSEETGRGGGKYRRDREERAKRIERGLGTSELRGLLSETSHSKDVSRFTTCCDAAESHRKGLIHLVLVLL